MYISCCVPPSFFYFYFTKGTAVRQEGTHVMGSLVLSHTQAHKN